MSEMQFEIAADDGITASLVPLTASILHSHHVFDLQKRLASVADDIAKIQEIAKINPLLAEDIKAHQSAINTGTNDTAIRTTADKIIQHQTAAFGESNAAAVTTIEQLPPTPLEEDIKGKEGRILTRLHSYRERDRNLVTKAKAAFKAEHKRLFCECCGFDPATFYGNRGTDRIQAHHRTPVEELLPDSVTTSKDLTMVCPNCHDIIHSKRPWITVEKLHEELAIREKRRNKK